MSSSLALWSWLSALPTWTGTLLVVAASFAAARLVVAFGETVVERVVEATPTRVDQMLYEEFRLPVTVSVAFAGLYVASRAYAFADGGAAVLGALALSAPLLFWARGLIRVGGRLLEALTASTAFGAEVVAILENLWTFVVLASTALVLLSLWHVRLTPLLASAGVAGVALGFAARDTVSNFFGSIALYFDETYAVGDYLVLDSGVEGTVVDVSIRSTRILTREDAMVTVPNAALNAATLENRSDPMPETRVEVGVGVAYGTDLDRFEAIAEDAAAATPTVVDSPSPRTRLVELGNSALRYEVRAWVRSPRSDERAAHELRRRLHDRLRDADVELPYPTRTLRVDDDHEDGFEWAADRPDELL